MLTSNYTSVHRRGTYLRLSTQTRRHLACMRQIWISTRTWNLQNKIAFFNYRDLFI